MAKRLLDEHLLLVPVYTPFSQDGENLALDVIPKYAQFLAEKGMAGVLVNGTNGEGMAMTVSERISVAEAWMQAGHANNFHVQIQVGGTNVKDVLTLAKHAGSKGADSMLCLPELYYRPQTVAALVKYLKMVADAAPSTPLVFYHNPGRSNVRLNLSQVIIEARKAIPTFAGLKLAEGDMNVAEACRNAAPSNFNVFFGSYEIMVASYISGCTSWTPATSNLFPNECQEILDDLKKDRYKDAQQKLDKHNDKITQITQYGDRIACFKVATEIITGFPMGPTRFPLQPLDAEQKEQLKKTIQKVCAS